MLYYQTVTELLKKTLVELMKATAFNDFRLVGGTALSLQLGHRISVDIDLFTDRPYGSLDFDALEEYLKHNFNHVSPFSEAQPSFGKSYSIGTAPENVIKLDIFYTDTFIQPAQEVDGIRMATLDEIAAMKMEVIQNGGRKKDFWDVHELLPTYDLESLFQLHEQRYPYQHQRNELIENLGNFTLADDDFDPICLKGKIWEFIKEDIMEALEPYQQKNG